MFLKIKSKRFSDISIYKIDRFVIISYLISNDIKLFRFFRVKRKD